MTSRSNPTLCEHCGEPVVEAAGSGGTQQFNPQPHNDGIYRLRDVGGDKPAAVRLTTAQQFGQQGKLYQLHSQTCSKKPKYRPKTRQIS